MLYQRWGLTDVSQFHDCKAAVDALADPDPPAGKARYQRVQGEVDVEACLPKAKTIEQCIRRWMVDPVVLDAHPEWLTSHRVVGNGILWGDAEDPVLPSTASASKRKKNDEELTGGSKKKTRRRAIDLSEIEKQDTTLNSVLKGCDLEELVDKLT